MMKLAILVLALSGYVVNGLKCYNCDPNNPYDECYKINSCAGTKESCNHCVTIETNSYVLRACETTELNITNGEFCKNGKLEDGSDIKSCFCDSDLCNSKTVVNNNFKFVPCYVCTEHANGTRNGGPCFDVNNDTQVKEGCGVCTTTEKGGSVSRECVPFPAEVPGQEFCTDTNSTDGVSNVCFCNNLNLCNSKLIVVKSKNGVDGLVKNSAIIYVIAILSTFLLTNWRI